MNLSEGTSAIMPANCHNVYKDCRVEVTAQPHSITCSCGQLDLAAAAATLGAGETAKCPYCGSGVTKFSESRAFA